MDVFPCVSDMVLLLGCSRNYSVNLHITHDLFPLVQPTHVTSHDDTAFYHC